MLTAQASVSIDSLMLEDKPISVYVETESGVAIVSTAASYIGIDADKNEAIWSIERGAFMGLGQRASGDANDADVAEDYLDLNGLPFVMIRKQLLDARNGNMLVGAEDAIKNLRSYEYLRDRNLLLLETAHKGSIRLMGLDAETGERKFNVQLRESKTLDGSANQSTQSIRFDDAGNLLYDDGRSLSLIDVKNDKLLWNTEVKVAKLYFQDNNQHVLVAEKPTGLLSIAGMGKVVHLLNYQTGELLWNDGKGLKLGGNLRVFEPYDGGFILGHTDGANIYDWKADPEPRWKKDFDEKGVRRIEIKGKVLNITYKGKMMPVDALTGQARQKKPEKVGGYFMGMSMDEESEAAKPVATMELGGKTLSMLNAYKLTWGEKEIYYGRVAIDPVNNRVITARPITEGSDLKKKNYKYIITVHSADGTSSKLEKMIYGGVRELRVDAKGNFVVASNFAAYHYAATAGQPTEIGSVALRPIINSAEKTAAKLGKLLGDSGDDEERVPANLSSDYGAERQVRAGVLPLAELGKATIPYVPIKGMFFPEKKKGEKRQDPYLMISIYDMLSSEEVYHRKGERNINFVTDYVNQRIYYLLDEKLITLSFE
ncbi:hypothetical protein CEQ90_10205 [Lewinellaceae bacterium SD302]|nr:hypothetical protein CEQ90_10205 [Lewinellaceae bacterium SD302]